MGFAEGRGADASGAVVGSTVCWTARRAEGARVVTATGRSVEGVIGAVLGANDSAVRAEDPGRGGTVAA